MLATYSCYKYVYIFVFFVHFKFFFEIYRARQLYVIRANSKASQISLDAHNPIPCIDAPFIIDLDSRLFIERRGLTGEFIVYLDDPKLDTSSKKVNNIYIHYFKPLLRIVSF